MIVAPGMLSTKPIPPEERLIVALDLPSPEAAWQMVQRWARACASTSSAWSCSWPAAASS